VNWRAFPFLLLTPALIAGTLLYEAISLPVNYYLPGVLIVFILVSIYLVIERLKTVESSLVLFIVLLISFVLLGYLNSMFTRHAWHPAIETSTLDSCNNFVARVDSRVEKTERSNRYQLTIQKIRIDQTWKQLEAKAILYAPDEVSLQFGDIILVKGKPQFLEHQRNPHAFDYALYLERKGIYLQAYCSSKNHLIINRDPTDIRYLTVRIGDFFEELLRKHIRSERELNMAKAMVVGRRNDVTPDMEYVYEATGTSHILAVSGLHVGIIFLLASTVFKYTKRLKLPWLYYILILFSIWSFAMITGLSPSVRRAGLMLSFIVIAEMIRRKSNIYNTIFASAFCILLVAPNLIYSVSFQFSYAAVLGIVFLYKKIYALIYVNNRILDFFWQITALSLSVQIATFPINIYYFNHFPTLFAITNLFAIPTAMVVVVGSISIFLASPIPVISDILGWVLQYWIYGYNELLLFFSKLPFASLHDLSLKTHYVFLILALTFIGVRFIEVRRLFLFRLFTVVFGIISLLVFYEYFNKSVQYKLVVYSVPGRDYIDIFTGRTCYTNANAQNERSIRDAYFSLHPNRKYHLISEIKKLSAMRSSQQIGENTLLVANGKTMLIFQEPYSITALSGDIQLDYLIVGKRSIPHLDFISQTLRYHMLILDATIDAGDCKKIEDSVLANKIHHVLRDGALSISI
jgi:competence protein ComEC